MVINFVSRQCYLYIRYLTLGLYCFFACLLQFWVAYVGCSSQFKDAVEQTMEQVDVIKRLINAYPDNLQFATSADGKYWRSFFLSPFLLPLSSTELRCQVVTTPASYPEGAGFKSGPGYRLSWLRL
jgi:hypothetical protein